MRCPLCGCEGKKQSFVRAGEGNLRCRRCRREFADPDAYKPELQYICCDSGRAVSIFPFEAGGGDCLVRVDEGYAAAAQCSDGRRLFMQSGEHMISCRGSLTVYFIRLKPLVMWGTRTKSSNFGAHGKAQLSFDSEWVKSLSEMSVNELSQLESRLREKLNTYMTAYVEMELRNGNRAPLMQPAGYIQARGNLDSNISVERISLLGYTNGGNAVTLADDDDDFVSAIPDEAAEIISAPPFRRLNPRQAKPPYAVPNGSEDVLLYTEKPERHKSGEEITEAMLKNCARIVRFTGRNFTLPWGWGLSNVPGGREELFSANGTISFFVDHTGKFSELFAKADGWESFSELFFTNVLRHSLIECLPRLMSETPNADISTLSVMLTRALNGERNGYKPAFRKHGLRVDVCDICGMSFYSDRRQ